MTESKLIFNWPQHNTDIIYEQTKLFSDNEMFEHASYREYEVWFISGSMEPERVYLVTEDPYDPYVTTGTGYLTKIVKARDRKEAMSIAKAEIAQQRVKDLEQLLQEQRDYIEILRDKINEQEKIIENQLLGRISKLIKSQDQKSNTRSNKNAY